MLSADGSVQVRSDAIGAAYYPYRICSSHRLLSRRPRSPPIQRRPYTFFYPPPLILSISPYLLPSDVDFFFVNLLNSISYYSLLFSVQMVMFFICNLIVTKSKFEM